MTYQREKVRERQSTIFATQNSGIGIVANVPLGEWNTTSQYKKLNIVRSHNASYMAKKDNVGIEPTIAQGWQEVWQVVAYDGGQVSPDGTYPNMSVGQATNDGNGNNIADQFNSIREDIQNESHFRGYLATNAEIQALQATPNDYAYSAESGTMWIYQTATGWTNSGRPVPDQITPKSTTLPLMNGTASAGTANAYAAGDHIHPSDVKKVDKTQIVQETGQSTTALMSQKAVTDELGLKVNNAQIVQDTGDSITNIMSQKIVTDLINENVALANSKWKRTAYQLGSGMTTINLVVNESTSFGISFWALGTDGGSVFWIDKNGANVITQENTRGFFVMQRNKFVQFVLILNNAIRTLSYNLADSDTLTFRSRNLYGAMHVLDASV